MTAKRFYRNRGTIWENDNSLSLGEVEELLNEQHEVIAICENRIAELRKENKQFKSTIKEAYNNERTMIGKSVLKQLIEQME
jgi:hypothetical protein